MFSAQTYIQRRKKIIETMKSGIGVFLANQLLPMNYSDNTFHFRQDSTFLYYFGIDEPGIAAMIDFDSGETALFADELTLEDIIWMGRQKTFAEKKVEAGIDTVKPFAQLAEICREEKRKIHYLHPYQAEVANRLSAILGISSEGLKAEQSIQLLKNVVAQRSIKSAEEVAEITNALTLTYKMHTDAMKMAAPGRRESELAGHIEGIALSGGSGVSFPVILSVHPEILHNHSHSNILRNGDLLVNDSGAEAFSHYAADITRTFPVNGSYSQQQKEIYQIVLDAQMAAIDMMKPGVYFKEVHLKAAATIASGLKDLGLMKGDVQEAVQAGAHALFFPHGLGHMMGLDVHDMENLGEQYVGYDQTVTRSEQFGLAYLRFAKKMEPGHVLTVEPGLYFIPELIQQWKKTNKLSNFIEYGTVEKFIGFGGVRIEDDVLITDMNNKVLGPPIPKTIADVEDTCRQSL